MTVRDYITDKFQTFGIQLSEADIYDITLNVVGTELSDGNIGSVNVGMVNFVPQLLLRATSISEGGISMSWNIQGIKDYYSLMCKTYGLDDKLNPKKRIVFL